MQPQKEERFVLQLTYLVQGRGWQHERHEFVGTYEQAGREASKQAHRLNALYGDSHFWTVDLKHPETNGSYFQLFHGRLS